MVPDEATASTARSRQHRLGKLRQCRPQDVQRPSGSDPERAGEDGSGAGEKEAGETENEVGQVVLVYR